MEEIYALTEKVVAGVASVDTVVAVGVDELREVLVGLYEGIDQLGGVLIVDVVVG